ncbi:globin domain-containing protein [Pelagicoccus albus]|uniref:Hemoglobin-like flavoprotein n=1 Tax=Pelagicoccus albus TaxID=415222 RepID=A0A7X1E8E3_9BACT|nr:hypothetical protein [Pelagicoccus albus]
MPISDIIADIFYAKLFAEAPSLKPYFESDIRQNGRIIKRIIDIAVQNLDTDLRTEETHPTFQQIPFIVEFTDRNHSTIGSALAWTLRQIFSHEFTEEMETVWLETYTKFSADLKNTTSYVAA